MTRRRSAACRGRAPVPSALFDRRQQFYAAGLSSRTIATLLPCMNTGRTTTAQRRMLRTERDRLATRVDEMTHALHRLDELITAADHRGG
ncbi:hypothetical protein AB0I53_27020 [Saccharopolyspora sp. NPDC050389]|uniref:hypothetical protein n=1 Tax=Saccharopolyspora sp. NPDC050389 TaxID=3155516 RepID=UPI0033C8E562